MRLGYRRALPGSSPRGRGTAGAKARRLNNRRFIPAWAGNRRRRMMQAIRFSVHPRVGGEQDPQVAILDCVASSSPRGRGTGSGVARGRWCPRFIPAWAGNRQRPRHAPIASSVHPRVGGEQVAKLVGTKRTPGSSPRGRGTGLPSSSAMSDRRFIPAWAGNSGSRTVTLPNFAVHPRVGGEQGPDPSGKVKVSGSSPRGRGTEPPSPLYTVSRRFIPAWAGNSRIGGLQSSYCPVHPRVGGEQSIHACALQCSRGSSPRGRGTDHRQPLAP